LNSFVHRWVEQYLFFPNPLQKIISVGLFPLTLAYCIIITYKRLSAKIIDFGLPIISIGNLVVGGSGKTPVTIALAKDKKDVAIILRGYGRESKGLYVVSDGKKILENVTISGDEAYMLAQLLPKAIVIVCENRVDAIIKVKEMGAKIVFLDDGYSSHHIKKFNLLIRPKDEPTNLFCLPSGGYRDTKMMYAFADLVLQDGKDFHRVVSFELNGNKVEELPQKILLLTAISKPNRLKEFLPKNITMISFPDHYNYKKSDIDTIIQKYPSYSIITTQKDFVKLEKFKIKDLYLLKLDILIQDCNKIDIFLGDFKSS